MTIPVIIAAFTIAAAPAQRAQDVRLVREWTDAVNAHRPGTIDAPLVKIAKESANSLEDIRRSVRAVLEAEFDSEEDRSAILRRGAMLHTDIALLLPKEASEFTRIRGRELTGKRDEDNIFLTNDGQFTGNAVVTAHWWFASQILEQIRPNPAADPFVAGWHRAVIAHFEDEGAYGAASYAIPRASVVLPDDPIILMYTGAMHDVTASDHLQSVRSDSRVRVGDADSELKLAERFFRRSVDAGGPPEARIRLGRVLGALGHHQEAVEMLRSAQARLDPDDARLVYFASLFLGTEEAALGHVDAAREQFGRARATFPTAQSAMIALADACFKGNQPTCATEALRSLEALTSREDKHNDPWVRYFVSLAADSEEQMQKLRDSISDGGER